CNRYTATIQYFHGLVKAIAYRSHPLCIGDAAVIKYQFSSFAGAHAQFVFFFACREARCATLYDKGCAVILCTRFAGARYYNSYIFEIAKARAAILCRYEYAHEAELAHFMKQIDRELLTLIPLHHIRADVLVSKVAYHLRNRYLCTGITKLHIIYCN